MTTDQRPQPQSDTPTPEHAPLNRGVDVEAGRDVTIGGDVVGRDKLIGGDEVHGDKIITSGDVVIRRQINRTVIHIGQFNVPLGMLLLAGSGVLVVLVLIGAGVARLNQAIAPTPTPGRMASTTFNVVVAEFGELDANGQLQVTELSRALSQSVYDTLQAQREALPDPIIKSSLAIRHGNLPVTDDVVTDETSAARVADELGADMVIYGHLAQRNPATRDLEFTPQFYVPAAVRGDIDALLTGNQNSGTVIFAPNVSPGMSLNTHAELRTQVSALFFIATGLAYDVFGQAAFSLEVYRQAGRVLVDWPERNSGKEVLYFFWGQAALFRAQQLTGQPAADLLSEAEAAFQSAIGSNPNYARAYIGLGSALYVKLQRADPVSNTLSSPDLPRMLAIYDRAPELARAAGDRLAEQVGVYSQGLGLYQLGRAQRITDPVAAQQLLTQAAERVSATLAPFAELKQPRLLAQAHLALGAIAVQQAEILIAQGNRSEGETAYRRARDAYQACVDQGPTTTDRILIDLIIRDRCQPQLDRVTQILAGQ